MVVITRYNIVKFCIFFSSFTTDLTWMLTLDEFAGRTQTLSWLARFANDLTRFHSLLVSVSLCAFLCVCVRVYVCLSICLSGCLCAHS